MRKHNIIAGQGLQLANRTEAIMVLEKCLDAEITDKDTVIMPGLGKRHVSCYTSTVGAMVLDSDGDIKSGIYICGTNVLMVQLRESDGALNVFDIDPEKLRPYLDGKNECRIGLAGLKWPLIQKVADHKWLITSDLETVKQWK
ncbi:hypothetical protein Ga0123462_0859 [Mariprofundus ferrinatatus]|uniref:Uncharacterized protein n=1 Tax=Mariprofundus ferrinatatus TaxID=1921087 RepID=A0A2K8L320_9PROT|nr:hypothetical protein [Mariprofundus ferrinatatus]ATX81728.1 hypothetical protein Ga0123462_0859 [Mariprofundus ferrinatatus]